MNILEGTLPEGKLWRTLVLFPVGHEPGLAWQLARQLARANSGALVATVFIPPGSSEGTIGEARETLGRVRRTLAEGESAYTLLIETAQHHQSLLYIIERGDIDLLLADGDNPEWDSLDQLSAPVMVVRGAAYRAYYEDRLEAGQEQGGQPAIKSILVPTAGGPNSAVALSLLLPLAPAVKITTLYVVPDYLGENEEAHGEARLRQLAKFTDAGDRVERKVIRADSVVGGLVSEASGPYDLVILGATRESTLERALFGDVVGSVVRDSRTPVVVVREAASTMGSISRNLAWRMQRVIPRLSLSERTQVYVRIRRSARPDTDFFVLIGLSALIAALGLMLSSPAVVIGAMLVAPLMSPMVGAGLAVVMGNTRFLRLALSAIARGMLLAIFLSLVVGLIRPNQPPTPEILSRTEPTLIDLGVAVFAGLAGAYALAHSEAAAALPGVAISAALVPPLASVGISLATGYFTNALGALLLFSTNLVGIIAAGVAVFVILGFRPSRAQKEERYIQMRSVRVAMVSLIAITATLGVSTYRLAQESARNTFIREVVARQVNAMPGVEFAELEPPNLAQDDEPLSLNITVRSTHLIPHAQVEELRDRIGADIHQEIPPDREVTLTLTVIRVTKLDPEVPPTPTPTPTNTETPTPGPTPTDTLTPTPTDTPTPTLIPVLPSATLTPTITATVPPPPTETPVPPPPPTDTPPGDTATPGPSPTADPEGSLTPAATVTSGGTATPSGDATPTPAASATSASGRAATSTPAATASPSPATSPPSPTQPANVTSTPPSPTPEDAIGLLFGRAAPAF